MQASHTFHMLLNRETLWLLLSVFANVAVIIYIRVVGSQMYPFFIAFYVWVALYALFVALVLRCQRMSNMPLLKGPAAIVLALTLLVATRLLFLGQTEMISLDALWYLDFGKFMVRGSLPYRDFYFPYPPLFAYVIRGVMAVAPCVDAFRVISTIADACVALVLWRLARHLLDDRWASVVIVAYALLPVSIIESGWNGHFEPIANTFLLLSLWFLLSGGSVASGFFLGLGAATKVYPVLLFPILLFYQRGRRSRLLFTTSLILALALSYLPLYVLGSLYPSPSTRVMTTPAVQGSSPAQAISVVFHLLSSVTPIVVLVGLAIMAATVAMIRCRTSCDSLTCESPYYWALIVLSLVLICMGLAFGIYPLLPQSRLVYWRYPADIGIVRSITTVSTGLMLLVASLKRFSSQNVADIGPQSLLILLCATILLMSTLIRDVFYGWYLLWSLPLFFLLKKRSLALTLILCLLLLYPSYTHDNFESLGYNENRVWSEDFTFNAWSVAVNTSSVVNSSFVGASIEILNHSARLVFDTTHVNKSQLTNVSIVYQRRAFFRFDRSTEFVVRIGAEWDPTFEAYASIAVSYRGTDVENRSLRGYIVPPTQIFTNLTHILWRYAFSLDGPMTEGIINMIAIEVLPLVSTRSAFVVDFMYTTQVGPLNPLWFVTLPNLTAISLAAYIILRCELERYDF
ncbi:MAG: ArnT family glycosyltransferase [Candidatus Thorarchaeota archaeon]